MNTEQDYFNKPGMAPCTEACYAMPTCTVCGLAKQPRGRSAPMVLRFCNSDCSGYYQEPRAGHYWPEEHPDRVAPLEGEKP